MIVSKIRYEQSHLPLVNWDHWPGTNRKPLTLNLEPGSSDRGGPSTIIYSLMEKIFVPLPMDSGTNQCLTERLAPTFQ